MMKRAAAALIAVALLGGAAAFAQEEFTPYDVTTMDEAEQFLSVDALWEDGWPSYAQEHGFEPVKLTPEEAYKALYRAYEGNQWAGYVSVLHKWGFSVLDEGSVPYGWPERKALGEDVWMDGETVSLEAIRFTGGYADVSDYTLIFMKHEYGDWQLIDMMQGEAESVQMTEEGPNAEAFIEFLLIGHGTGYYAEMISVYNPRTRRCEASYTRVGNECPLLDRNLYLSAWADYGYDGLKIVSTAVFGTYEQSGTMRVFTQRAQASDVYVYALEGEGLRLRVHERHEDLNPAVLRAQDTGDYLSGDILFLQ